MRPSACSHMATERKKNASHGGTFGPLHFPGRHSFSVTVVIPLGLAATLVLSPTAPVLATEEAVTSPDEGAGAEEGIEPDLSDVRVELAELNTELEEARERATELIEEYMAEHERLEEATERREGAESQAESADENAGRTRLSAARQAAAAYKGSDLSAVHAWTGPRGPAEVLERGAYLDLLDGHRSDDLDRAEAAQVVSGALASAAASAETAQEKAAEEADSARTRAEEAVQEQEERAQELMLEQSRLEGHLAEGRDPEADDEARENALKDARSAQLPGGEGAGTLSPVGSGGHGCETVEAASFGNGQIPDAALCPLPQAGEKLRADAAEAFLELDSAFHEEFGRPMCVTDSYRPYHEQARLFQEMSPGMAAEPGTSRHGLGVAVDLCGGVEQLGTAEHEWMLDNAPDHGWGNPEWARGGFEPWHWEYGG